MPKFARVCDQFGSLRCAHRTRSYDRPSLLPLVEVLPPTGVTHMASQEDVAERLEHPLLLVGPSGGQDPVLTTAAYGQLQRMGERVDGDHDVGHPVHVSRGH